MYEILILDTWHIREDPKDIVRENMLDIALQSYQALFYKNQIVNKQGI